MNSTFEHKQILDIVTDFYLQSGDFNGLPVYRIDLDDESEFKHFKSILSSLIQDELIGMVFPDTDLNPHIIRFGFEPTHIQIDKLTGEGARNACIYPRHAHLKDAVDQSTYADAPYTLELALGEAQLAHRPFDLSILEIYRNDPRYEYDTDDIHGSISISGDYAEDSPDAIDEKDQILLQTFGFAYDNDLNRSVAVYLRYLSDLSPEHQRIWKSKQLEHRFKLHPDYYRTTIEGNWGQKVMIFDALLAELRVINKMASVMSRPPLFRKDFGEYGEDKPVEFGFLVRPTLREFNDFVLLLDKMLSDNINQDFFQDNIALTIDHERDDGKIEVQRRGTLQLLDLWLRKYYQTDDWEFWDTSFKALKKVRKLRQKPAHSIKPNQFDQKYFHQQRELIIAAYDAVRNLRMMIENHPAVRLADMNIPKWQREGQVWHY